MPPSPVVITLRGWNEKQAIVAVRPADPLPVAVPRGSRCRSRRRRPRSSGRPWRVGDRDERGEVARHADLVDAQDRLGRGGDRRLDRARGRCSSCPGRRRRTPASRRSSVIALAVAMYEWLTVITSSPGPTPTPSSARCSAVVQFDTAQACARADERGELLLERGDLGALRDPAGQDRRAGRRRPRAGPSPAWRSGHARVAVGHGGSTSVSPLHAPPVDQIAQAGVEVDLGLEARAARARALTCRPGAAAPG